MALNRWTRVVGRLDGGFVALVDRLSPEAEKSALLSFANGVKAILGREGPFGDQDPFIEPWDLADDDKSRRQVFVAVIHGSTVGYANFDWHHSITDSSRRTLGLDGKPLKPRFRRPRSVAEILDSPDESDPWLQGWCLEAIVVDAGFQRRGIGVALVRASVRELETTLNDLAYGEPISDDGAALLGSLGLQRDSLRLCWV